MVAAKQKRRSGGARKKAAGPGVESLEKVRDILFGSQVRESAKRFSELEQRQQKSASALRAETKGRLDALESYLSKEVESVLGRLKAEQAERTEAVKGLAGELKKTAKAVEAGIQQLGARATQAQRNLHKELLDQSKALRDEVQSAHQEMRTLVDGMCQELRAGKVDRSALAELFSELALRLAEEPGKGK